MEGNGPVAHRAVPQPLLMTKLEIKLGVEKDVYKQWMSKRSKKRQASITHSHIEALKMFTTLTPGWVFDATISKWTTQ